MTVQALHEPPRASSVFAYQLRKVGRILRPELIGLTVILAVTLFMGLSLMLLSDAVLDYPRELEFLIPLAVFILPFRLWHGERLFDRAELWTLPVERQKHALIRVAAGAVWTAMIVVVVVAVFNLLALISNSPTIADTLAEATPGAGEAGAWLWFVPLGSAIVFYLLASGVVLALRRPLRWSAALVVGGMMVSAVAQGDLVSRIVDAVIDSRLGLASVWGGGETAAQWGVALAFWLGVSLAIVALGSARHRER